MSAEAITQYKTAYQAQLIQAHQEAEQPVIDLLPSLGGSLISAAETAPLVVANVPAGAIAQLEASPNVVVIDLLVEGGLDVEVGHEKETAGGPDWTSLAQPAKPISSDTAVLTAPA